MEWIYVALSFFALAYTPELAGAIERFKAERRRRRIVARVLWGTEGSR